MSRDPARARAAAPEPPTSPRSPPRRPTNDGHAGTLTIRHSDATSSGTVAVHSRQAAKISWARGAGKMSARPGALSTGRLARRGDDAEPLRRRRAGPRTARARVRRPRRRSGRRRSRVRSRRRRRTRAVLRPSQLKPPPSVQPTTPTSPRVRPTAPGRRPRPGTAKSTRWRWHARARGACRVDSDAGLYFARVEDRGLERGGRACAVALAGASEATALLTGEVDDRDDVCVGPREGDAAGR